MALLKLSYDQNELYLIFLFFYYTIHVLEHQKLQKIKLNLKFSKYISSRYVHIIPWFLVSMSLTSLK